MLLVLGAATGCTDVVGGSVRPAPGLVPRPLAGHTVQQVLLDDTALSRVFGQPFEPDRNWPAQSGGSEVLTAKSGAAAECDSVPRMLLKNSYAGADVRDVVRESWWNSGSYEQHMAVISVHEGVVAFPAARAAYAQFTAFAQQWRRCSGVSVDFGDNYFTFDIGQVQEKDSVLLAFFGQRGSTTVPSERAIGVRANCIVEVDVAFFGIEQNTPTAADVARLMMDKVSSLS